MKYIIFKSTQYRYSPFWTEGYSTPTFQNEKVKNLLSPAVNRGDLRRLNYNKTIFGLGSASDPAGRAHDALPDPKVGWGGIWLPPHSDHSSPFSARDLWTVLFLNWYPSLFRPKLRPWEVADIWDLDSGCSMWSDGAKAVLVITMQIYWVNSCRLEALYSVLPVRNLSKAGVKTLHRKAIDP